MSLLGTVWGILNALVGIGIAGQASIDKGLWFAYVKTNNLTEAARYLAE